MPLTFSRVDQPRLMKAAAKLTGSTGFAPGAHALAVYHANNGGTEERRMRVICVFEPAGNGGATMHFAGLRQRWYSPDFEVMLRKYAFEVKGYRFVRAHIAATNTQAQIAALHAGFQIEGVLRHGAAGGEDAIVLTINAPARSAQQRATPPGGGMLT